MDYKKPIMRNMNTNLRPNNSGSSMEMWMWIIVYFVVAIIVCYLSTMTIKYLSTKCFEKHSWFRYIFSFCYSDVCKTPEEPVVNHVYYMDTPSNKPADVKNSQAPHGGKTSPAVDFDINDLGEKKQVFHISNQDYTYEQAKCKCASYDAKLATYAQMVNAYNNGAEWCSYGWSQGQTAYYPTQKCTWEKKSEKERKKCGKPGINGGFFSDPFLKFGVNCYGKKPEGEVVKLKDKKCPAEDYCKRTENAYANKRLPTDQIAPFNSNQWSI